jgi:hypothetical protein
MELLALLTSGGQGLYGKFTVMLSLMKGHSLCMAVKLTLQKNTEPIIGNDFNMSTECALVAAKKMEIGNQSGISWELDTDIHHIADEPEYAEPLTGDMA